MRTTVAEHLEHEDTADPPDEQREDKLRHDAEHKDVDLRPDIDFPDEHPCFTVLLLVGTKDQDRWGPIGMERRLFHRII